MHSAHGGATADETAGGISSSQQLTFLDWIARTLSTAASEHNSDQPSPQDELALLHPHHQGHVQAGGTLTPGEFQWLVKALLLASNAYLSVSHLHWALWGLVQAKISAIDFDFVSYGEQRLEQFNQQVCSLPGSSSLQ